MISTNTTLTFSKSTKGTHVYTDAAEGAAIPTLYIKKSALPDTPPPSIKVVLEYAG